MLSVGLTFTPNAVLRCARRSRCPGSVDPTLKRLASVNMQIRRPRFHTELLSRMRSEWNESELGFQCDNVKAQQRR